MSGFGEDVTGTFQRRRDGDWDDAQPARFWQSTKGPHLTDVAPEQPDDRGRVDALPAGMRPGERSTRVMTAQDAARAYRRARRGPSAMT